VPFDSAVTNRPGCRLGPRAIRASSVELASLNSYPFGIDPFQHINVIDYGDCYLNTHKPESIEGSIYQHAKSIIKSGTKMLTFGGDHFISLPLLRAHAEVYGPVSLLQFDSHCDTWEPQGPIDHGTMFLTAVNEGLINVDNSIQVGLRTHNKLDVGIEVIDIRYIHEHGIKKSVERILKRIAETKCYLTFDIDFLDPAFAPGTGTPVCGGVATWQALEFIRSLENINFVGMDLVEVSPPFDHAEITSMAAATVAHDWICIMANQKRKLNL
jgi:agmatinase